MTFMHLQITYLATGSNLSWVELFMVELVVSQSKVGAIQWTSQLPKLVISTLI